MMDKVSILFCFSSILFLFKGYIAQSFLSHLSCTVNGQLRLSALERRLPYSELVTDKQVKFGQTQPIIDVHLKEKRGVRLTRLPALKEFIAKRIGCNARIRNSQPRY